MMPSVSAWAAILVPWLSVAALWRRAGQDTACALGYGLAPAMAGICVLLVWGPYGTWTHLYWGTLGLTAVAGIAAWAMTPRQPSRGRQAITSGARWLVFGALALLAWRLIIVWHEAPRYAFYPWDSWLVWALKAKIWWAAQHILPIVSPRAWVAAGAPLDHYPMPWWSYPPLVPATLTWSAIAIGQFDPPRLIGWWPACYLALIIGVGAQVRRLRDTTTGIVAAALVAGIPLLITHAALPGNADLALTLAVSLALGSAFLWQVQRRRGDLIATLVLLACALLIKREGITWFAVIAAGLVFCEMTLRWRLIVLGLGAFVLGLALLGNGLTFQTPLGVLTFNAGVIELPILGRFELGVHDVLGTMVMHLWVADTWGLLWWLLPLLVAWRLPWIVEHQAARRCSILVGLCLLKLVLLFVFTDAYRWVEAGTAINRLFLHIAPALIVYGALLLPERSATPVSDAVRVP